LLKRSKIDDDFDDDFAKDEVGGASGGSSVLVVNDDHDSCELIARLVESAGWKAQRCYDPDDAAKELDRASADFTAVVVDLSTGLVGGIDVLDAARRQPSPRSMVPVMLLSSRAEDDTVAWQAGADGVMIRPFHANELLDELRSILSRTPDERSALRATKTRV
jgi:DNA-binding response OmpR family regulator